MAHVLRGVTLSYPNLFVPKMPMNPKPGQKARFTAMILIPAWAETSEENKAFKALQEVCYGLLKEKWGDRTDDLLAAGMRREANGIRWPFRTDNIKQDGGKRFDETKYKAFISPWTENQPGLVDRYQGPDGKPLKITQPSQTKFYAGCIVNVSVNPFVYDNSGNRGVNLGLVNLQHWGDGERLDNRIAAEDEFQAEARPETDLSVVGGESHTPATTGPRAGNLQNLFS